jgi:hypothetical protein
MKKNHKICLIFILLSLLFTNICVGKSKLPDRYPHLRRNDTLNLFGIHWRDAKINEYFYLIPAHFGATVFILVGNVVGTPLKAIYNLCDLNFNGEDYLPPVQYSAKHIAPIGGYIVGSPFWALEKILYEAPVQAYKDMFGDKEYKFADEEE